MDYGMFHVEHGYLEKLAEYSRALKQRNASLRSAQLEVSRSYNSMLSALAQQIHRHRESYIETLNAALQLTLQQMEVNFPVELELFPGMDLAEPLEVQLIKKETLDSRRGYTSVGIHRADLVVRTTQVLAARRLSRGQQKILVYALKIAQSIVFRNLTGSVPILLIDDLTAELDGRHLKRVMKLFQKLGTQLFITVLSVNQVDKDVDFKLFHVEHGLLS
jgi:DNA replication and repair protein RecF